MKKNCSAPNQGSLREYADTKRREAVKAILKCQHDEFRRGKVLTQKGYGIQAVRNLQAQRIARKMLAGRAARKGLRHAAVQPQGTQEDFTDADARKVFAGLFYKEPANAEKDAVQNFGVGLELTVKSHPDGVQARSFPSLGKDPRALSGVPDKPSLISRPRSAVRLTRLTEEMVTLYLFALVKVGGCELVSESATPRLRWSTANRFRQQAHRAYPWRCASGTPSSTRPCSAPAVASMQKGWDEVLPYARVLDSALKPANTPDEELQREKQLISILGSIKIEVEDTSANYRRLRKSSGELHAGGTQRDVRAAEEPPGGHQLRAVRRRWHAKTTRHSKVQGRLCRIPGRPSDQ